MSGAFQAGFRWFTCPNQSPGFTKWGRGVSVTMTATQKHQRIKMRTSWGPDVYRKEEAVVLVV